MNHGIFDDFVLLKKEGGALNPQPSLLEFFTKICGALHRMSHIHRLVQSTSFFVEKPIQFP